MRAVVVCALLAACGDNRPDHAANAPIDALPPTDVTVDAHFSYPCGSPSSCPSSAPQCCLYVSPAGAHYSECQTGCPPAYSYQLCDATEQCGPGDVCALQSFYSAGMGTFEFQICRAPRITVSLSPSSLSIKRGNGATVTVSVASEASQDTQLSAVGMPVDTTASFDLTSVANGGTSTLTIATLHTALDGDYMPVIEGTLGNIHGAAQLHLTITK